MPRTPEVDYKRLGRNIREAREAMKWTQMDLAFQLGWTRNCQPNIVAIEKGRRRITLETLVTLAYYCGKVSIDWLLYYDEEDDDGREEME